MSGVRIFGWRRSGAGMALALALSGPAFAGSFGDGSATSNPQLIDDHADCEACSALPPSGSGAPPWDIDWSVALRGVTRIESGDTTYSGEIVPTLTLSQQTLRGGYDLSATGTGTVDASGNARLDSLAVSGSGRFALDEWSDLTASGSITASEDDPRSGSYPANVARAPFELSAAGEVGASRRFGQFTLALRGALGRDSVGDTIYDDSSTTSNADRSAWTAALGGRLTAELAPGLTSFVDANAEWSRFDAAALSLLAKRDARTDTIRVGLGLSPDPLLKLEASVGLARADFVDASLADFTTTLYGASASYTPDETLTFSARLDTAIEAPATASAATASVKTSASGDVAVLVNPWLRLRGSAGWSQTAVQPAATYSNEWTAGLGADYLFNAMTDFTADYGWTRTLADPDPAKDVQRVTLGVTFHR